MKNKLRVALLCGGKSGERNVSLAGGREVLEALDTTKYEVTTYDPACDLDRLVRDSERIDVAFILLHGPMGEDGTVQGFLELLGIPYQCAGVLGSALAMDKDLAKQMYQLAGLPVAPWEMASENEQIDCDALLRRLGGKVVVKPVGQGSSLGMSVASTPEALKSGLENAFCFGPEVMVEEYITGREITVGVLGNKELTALPLVEIIPGKEHPFFDYGAKYDVGASEEICPAQLSDTITAKAQEYGLAAHKALRLKGYSRTDMIVTEQGEIFLIETNTIPGMTPTSLLPQAAAEYGLTFSALLDRLIALALQP